MQIDYADLGDDEDIDPSSEEGRKLHLDIVVTKITLDYFPLTREEREELATNEAALTYLQEAFISDFDWGYMAETVWYWRQGRGAAA
jgi:hypothetical protein